MPALLHHLRQRLEHVLRFPAHGDVRPDVLHADHLHHLVEAGVTGHTVIIWHLVLVGRGDLVTGDATSRHLPQHQTERVHVRHLVGVEVAHVDGAVQDLGGHVPPGAAPASDQVCPSRIVDLVRVAEVLDGQAEVGDATLEVVLHQDVLALDVAVGDGRFA